MKRILRNIFLQDLSSKASGLSQTRRFLIVGGIGCYTLAITHFLSGSQEHKGKWTWLMNYAVEFLGPNGPAYIYLILGTYLIVRALSRQNENY